MPPLKPEDAAAQKVWCSQCHGYRLPAQLIRGIDTAEPELDTGALSCGHEPSGEAPDPETVDGYTDIVIRTVVDLLGEELLPWQVISIRVIVASTIDRRNKSNRGGAQQ